MNGPYKVGDEVWVRDHYRRGERDEKGNIKQRSLYVKRQISGETSRSWVIGNERWNETKYPKTWKYPAPRFFTDAELEDELFIIENHYKIGQAVERTHDASVLREVARIIGYAQKDNT